MAVIDEYLKGIYGLLKEQNADELQRYLRVEPGNLPAVFDQLVQELRASFTNNKAIDRKINQHIPLDDEEEGGTSQSFNTFIQTYLQYWRDVNFQDLLETHVKLSALTNTCITALSHNQGLVCLPATIQICDALAKLAITLDKRPDLTQQLKRAASGSDGESRKTLVESTAEIIQKAFTTCLGARTSNPSGIKDGKPEGKKAGIFQFANLVLKMLFQCRKTRLANQLFTNISQHAPPLKLYSDRQRVTYLYYLGRFHFSNNHFYHAQSCLQAAYDQCHFQFTSQKRLILIFLISSNMILGRFPGQALLARPEAAGLAEKFMPIALAIQSGNMVAFKHAFSRDSSNERWFFHKGLLLPLQSRCEVLVWRSLARRVFNLTYQWPWTDNGKVPTLAITDLVVAAQLCQKVLEGWEKPTSNPLFVDSVSAALVPPPQGRKKLRAQQGVLFGNKMPNLLEVEAIIASLIQQKLLKGYISHAHKKFAILGSKQRGGPLTAGFPSVWTALKTRAEEEGRAEEVPGWVKNERKRIGGVVNLSGIARPVGAK
ncbi:COP9 signalosome-like protein complex subunit 12 [Bisporella sp. PMI_857]|nr:COP9 signalosome-like protein complex subunit 12 [Bisporella sp. PMI_857]